MDRSSYHSPTPASRRTRQQQTRNSAARDHRQALFADAKDKHKPKASTASEAQSIQQSLQRTQALLKGELHRVSQVATALDEDGQLLEDTKQTHQSLNVQGAQAALTSLQRAQQQEQRVLMASCGFFFTVVLYIMWCRILVKLPFVERLWIWMGRQLHELLGVTVMNQVQEWMSTVVVVGREFWGEAKIRGQEALVVLQEGLAVALVALQEGFAEVKQLILGDKIE